mgnify:FL=1
MVDEGTIVDSGEYIATLDRTEVADKLKNLASELDKSESQFTAQKLDTSIALREVRNNLVNLQYAVEEKKLVYDQSKYDIIFSTMPDIAGRIWFSPTYHVGIRIFPFRILSKSANDEPIIQ